MLIASPSLFLKIGHNAGQFFLLHAEISQSAHYIAYDRFHGSLANRKVSPVNDVMRNIPS